ncbi:type II secretion system protein [Paenibacillus sp. FSL R7-0204]|uniref:type II secretion system protein n=1 Tax=unclassified Paenibacillus TaxID=185978 RepID=UPI0030D80F39
MLAQAIKRRLSKKENQKGFTLIELLAVIVILGIIAVIAVPMISGIINKTKVDADLATARQVYESARLYVTAEKQGVFTSTSGMTVTVAELKLKKYLDNGIVLPSTKEPLSGGNVYFDADGTLVNLVAVDLRTSTLNTDSTMKKYKETEILSTEKE